MGTYREDVYTAKDGGLLVTYTFSDGEVWTKITDKHFNARTGQTSTRTRVWVQDLPGTTSIRASVKALTQKTGTNSYVGQTITSWADTTATIETIEL